MISKTIPEIQAVWKGAAKGQVPFLLLESQEPLCMPFLEILAAEQEKLGCTRFLPGNRVFAFKLRYCEPEASFDELQRYVYELENAGGFHGTFKGITAIDISEWCGNEQAEYFDAFLAYLHDHSDGLYFLFTAGTEQHRHLDAMHSKLAEYFHVHRAAIDLFHEDILLAYITGFFKSNHCQVPASIVKDVSKAVRNIMQDDHSFKKVKLLCDDMLQHAGKTFNRTAYRNFLAAHPAFRQTEEAQIHSLSIHFIEERGK